MSHQSHDYPEWVLLRNRREGLSVVDALFQSEPLGDKPGLVSLNLAFGVPLGLINLNPMGLAPSGNSNQPNLILVHGVHILLNCIIPPRGILSTYGLWKRDWVIYKCTVLMQIQNVIIRNGGSPLSFLSPQCHFTSHRWCLMWGINGMPGKGSCLGFPCPCTTGWVSTALGCSTGYGKVSPLGTVGDGSPGSGNSSKTMSRGSNTPLSFSS